MAGSDEVREKNLIFLAGSSLVGERSSSFTKGGLAFGKEKLHLRPLESGEEKTKSYLTVNGPNGREHDQSLRDKARERSKATASS